MVQTRFFTGCGHIVEILLSLALNNKQAKEFSHLSDFYYLCVMFTKQKHTHKHANNLYLFECCCQSEIYLWNCVEIGHILLLSMNNFIILGSKHPTI